MGLTQGLINAARERPDDLALVFGAHRFTWGAFGSRVARLAAVLRGLGVGDGDRVVILAASSHRYIEYYYATMWAGGIFAPLNTRLALPEILAQTADAEPVVLLFDSTFREQARQIAAATSSLRATIHADDGAAPEGALSYEAAISSAEPCADAGRSGDDTACLFYTGGTTGRSQGVMLSHDNTCARTASSRSSGSQHPRDSARVRAEDGHGDPQDLRNAGSRTVRRPRNAGADLPGDAGGAGRVADRVHPAAQIDVDHRSRGRGLSTPDDHAGRRSAGGDHIQDCSGRPHADPEVQSRRALFGLTPRKYQSGETDVTGGITRVGDEMVCTALYEATTLGLCGHPTDEI